MYDSNSIEGRSVGRINNKWEVEGTEMKKKRGCVVAATGMAGEDSLHLMNKVLIPSLASPRYHAMRVDHGGPSMYGHRR